MSMLTIEYSPEVLWALQQEPEEFEAEARLLLAIKMYETGRLSTGLAARLAGVPRSTLMFLLGRYELSPFGEKPGGIAKDLNDARRACDIECSPRMHENVGRAGVPNLFGVCPQQVEDSGGGESRTCSGVCPQQVEDSRR
jgi:hypothetical protein